MKTYERECMKWSRSYSRSHLKLLFLCFILLCDLQNSYFSDEFVEWLNLYPCVAQHPDPKPQSLTPTPSPWIHYMKNQFKHSWDKLNSYRNALEWEQWQDWLVGLMETSFSKLYHNEKAKYKWLINIRTNFLCEDGVKSFSECQALLDVVENWVFITPTCVILAWQKKLPLHSLVLLGQLSTFTQCIGRRWWVK